MRRALSRVVATCGLAAWLWPVHALHGQGPVVQGCSTFVDRTAPGADRDLTWGFSIINDPERCIQIALGQQVRWIGSFGAHPLDAEGGDTPSPIADHDEGLVTFTRPGVYGYVCGFHPAMRGAVRVVAPPAPASTNWIDTVYGAGQSNPETGVPRANELQGAASLAGVMNELLGRLAPSGGVRAYLGTTSAAAERVLEGSVLASDTVACAPSDPDGLPELNPGCQEIAPLDRPLQASICEDDPRTGLSGDRNGDAESLAFCARILVVVAANDSIGAYGEDAQACADFHALADDTPNLGFTFPDRRVGNLRGTGTLPSGAPITDWRTVLRLLYTGCSSADCPASTLGQRLVRCSSADRRALIESWGLLFQGVACPQSGGCPGGLRQAYRAGGQVEATLAFLEFLGLPPSSYFAGPRRTSLVTGTVSQSITAPAASQIFCDGGDGEGLLPTGLGPASERFPRGEPLYDAGDPVRRPCAPEDDLCAADGQLGVVRAIVSPRSLAVHGGEAYPTHQCQRRFAFLPYLNTALPVCPDRTTPSAGRCRFPFYESGSFRTFHCLASRNQVDARAAAGTDGRSYNFVVHAGDATGAVRFESASPRMPVVASWRQNMARLNSGVAFNGKQLVADDHVCTGDEPSPLIGCLVASSRCTLGVADHEAAFSAAHPAVHRRNEPAKLSGAPPSIAAIVQGSYPLARLHHLGALRGFENLMLDCVDRGGARAYCEDQVRIAGAVYDVSDAPESLMGGACRQAGLFPLPEAVCIGAQASTGTATTPPCGAPALQPKDACRPDTRRFDELTNRQNP